MGLERNERERENTAFSTVAGPKCFAQTSSHTSLDRVAIALNIGMELPYTEYSPHLPDLRTFGPYTQFHPMTLRCWFGPSHIGVFMDSRRKGSIRGRLKVHWQEMDRSSGCKWAIQWGHKQGTSRHGHVHTSRRRGNYVLWLSLQRHCCKETAINSRSLSLTCPKQSGSYMP